MATTKPTTHIPGFDPIEPLTKGLVAYYPMDGTMVNRVPPRDSMPSGWLSTFLALLTRVLSR